MSLIVLLDSSLEPTEVKTTTYNEYCQQRDKKEKNMEDKTIDERIEHKENLCTEQTSNGLLNTFLVAYNNHKRLVLRPDDIHLVLQLAYNNIINNNAEKLRDHFVSHEGKKELNIVHNEIDFDFFIDAMQKKIKQNIKNSDLIDDLFPSYNTTTRLIETASNGITISSFKKYFSYSFTCGCGIPSVRIEGSINDWLQLEEKYNRIKKVFSGLEDKNLDDWYNKMDTVLDLFISMRKLGDSGEIQATEYIKDLWKYVISFVPVGSGSDINLGGWISVLIPFTSNGKLKNFKTMDCLYKENYKPVAPFKSDNYYSNQDRMITFYKAAGFESYQCSVSNTPITLYTNHKKYDITLTSGFLDHPYFDTDRDEVMCNVISSMKQKDDSVGEKRQLYIDKGVEKDMFGINIPKNIIEGMTEDEMHNKLDELMILFNTTGCNVTNE